MEDYLPTQFEEGYEEVRGTSLRQSAMVEEMKERGIERVVYNLLRNG